MEAELSEIAKRVLRIPTLDALGSDRLDFHEVGVSGVTARRVRWMFSKYPLPPVTRMA